MENFLTAVRLSGKWGSILVLLLLFLLPCPGSADAEWGSRAIKDTFIPADETEVSPPEPIEEPPRKDWRDNIRPEPENKILAAWAYRPLELKEKPPQVNVLAPTWFYVTDEDGNGLPLLKNVSELGRKTDMKAYVDKAHEQQTQVWGTVVSFTPALSDALIHTPSYRREFIDKLVYYLETYQLDGINFDFENMNPLHKLDFTQFIKECSDALKPLGAVISVDVTVKSETESLTNWYQCYDHESLGEVVDYVAVMTYDEHKNHSEAGAVASIGWVENKLQGILEDVPSDKILLGIPFYAYDFRSTMVDNNPDLLIPTWSVETRGVTTTLMYQIEQLLNNDEYTDLRNEKIQVKEWLVKNEWDPWQGTYHLKFIDQNDLVHEIWYDEPTSLALKAKLVKKYHLAGAAVWRMNFGRAPFWEAVDKELNPPPAAPIQ